jgi:hypothetical protein
MAKVRPFIHGLSTLFNMQKPIDIGVHTERETDRQEPLLIVARAENI